MPKVYDQISITPNGQVMMFPVQMNAPPSPENKDFIQKSKRLLHSLAERHGSEDIELIEATFTYPGQLGMRIGIDLDQPIDALVKVYLRRLDIKLAAFSYDVEHSGRAMYSAVSMTDEQCRTLRTVCLHVLTVRVLY